MRRVLLRAALLLTALWVCAVVYVWAVTYSQTWSEPPFLTGPGCQVQARTGRVFLTRCSGPQPPVPTVVIVQSPWIRGQPGTDMLQWTDSRADQMRLHPRPHFETYIGLSAPVLPVASVTNGFGFGYGRTPPSYWNMQKMSMPN